MGYMQFQKEGFRKQLLLEASQKFTVLTVPLNELFKNKAGVEWKDKNKELVLNGHFYEIITYKVKNDVAEINLLADEAETNLFNSYFAQHHTNKNSNWQLLLALLSINLIEQSSDQLLNARQAENLKYCVVSSKPVEGCGKNLLLPPKVS